MTVNVQTYVQLWICSRKIKYKINITLFKFLYVKKVKNHISFSFNFKIILHNMPIKYIEVCPVKGTKCGKSLKFVNTKFLASVTYVATLVTLYVRCCEKFLWYKYYSEIFSKLLKHSLWFIVSIFFYDAKVLIKVCTWTQSIKHVRHVSSRLCFAYDAHFDRSFPPSC